jgi:integrase
MQDRPVMDAMPRPRPPNLCRQITRHGKTVWYVRIGKGLRIRLRSEFGSDEFDTEYQAAISGRPRPTKNTAVGTLAWLLARYRETTEWQQGLSTATRRQRENIFAQVLATAGTVPIAKIIRATILEGRERRSSTPAQARNFLDAMRGLFKWAAKAEHIKVDPTIGVENPPRKKNDGFIPWNEDHVAANERRWPIGTRQRVWLDVLLYTGLRRGDAVRFGRQHVREGVGQIKTEKSGFTVAVTLPILPVLADTLAAGPCGDLTFIAGESGQPLTKESFGNLFRAACRAAGVPGSAHGVRKIAATRAANAGATVAQLEAIFGWTGGTMASLYTRAADRERLAREAMHMLANEKRTSIPSPKRKVRAREQKSQ